MMALQSEVTRTDAKGNVWGPQQKITLEEAIRVGTINGAYASYEENLKGSIEAGKLADVLIVDGDVLADISLLEDRENFPAATCSKRIHTTSSTSRLSARWWAGNGFGRGRGNSSHRVLHAVFCVGDFVKRISKTSNPAPTTMALSATLNAGQA